MQNNSAPWWRIDNVALDVSMPVCGIATSRFLAFCPLRDAVVTEVMELFLCMLFGFCCAVLFLILRLVVVIRSSPKCKPGQKGPVCVLVVAGSGRQCLI